MKGEEAVRRLVDGEPDALDAVSAAYTPLLNYVILQFWKTSRSGRSAWPMCSTRCGRHGSSLMRNGAASPPGLPPWPGTRPSTAKEPSAAGRRGERSGTRGCPILGMARRSRF